MKDGALFVEFVGCWGSGKTAVIRELAGLLKEKGYRVARYRDFSAMGRRRRILLSLGYMLAMKGKELRCLLKMCAKAPALRVFSSPLDRSVFRTLIRNVLVGNLLIRRGNPDMLLWEGELHLLTILSRMHTLKEAELCCFLNAAPPRARRVLVFLDVPRETASARVLEDQRSGNHRRFGRIVGTEEIKRTLATMGTNQDRILRAVRSHAPGVPVIEADGRMNPRETAARIADALEAEVK